MYFLIAQTVFTKILPFCKWKSKRKIGQVKKGLIFSRPFCSMISNKRATLNLIFKFHDLTPNTILKRVNSPISTVFLNKFLKHLFNIILKLNNHT